MDRYFRTTSYALVITAFLALGLTGELDWISIVLYSAAVAASLYRDTRKDFGSVLLGEYAVYAPIVNTVSFTLVLWLIALWMYRKKIFVKISASSTFASAHNKYDAAVFLE